MQHVILFTENEAIRSHIRCGNQTERAHLELTLSLIGMGLSLVDDIRGLEVAYIGLPQYAHFCNPLLLLPLFALASFSILLCSGKGEEKEDVRGKEDLIFPLFPLNLHPRPLIFTFTLLPLSLISPLFDFPFSYNHDM